MYLFLTVFVLFSLLGLSIPVPVFEEINFDQLDPKNVPSELVFSTSQKNPEQLCVLNESSQSAVIFDSVGARCCILDGLGKRGIVMDQNMGVGVQLSSETYNFASFQDNVMNADLDVMLQGNAQISFDVKAKLDITITTLIKEIIIAFCPQFWVDILALGVDIGVALFKMFKLITTPIRTILKPILNMAVVGWKVFKGGFRALLNIFKWMGTLIGNIVGGVGVLVINKIKFDLALIIVALDGAKAFFVILDAIIKRINVFTILKAILTVPRKIVSFIVGLGGQVLRGITGLFILITKLFTFTLKVIDIVANITAFIRFVIDFIMQRTVTRVEVDQFTDQMLVVPQQCQQSYGAKVEYTEYNNFFLGLSNRQTFQINSLSLGTFVNLVVSPKMTGVKMIGEFTTFFKPLVPFGSLIPSMFKSMVKSLKDEKGRDHVRSVFENITIPAEGPVLEGYGKGRTGESTVDELQKVPVVKDLYNAFDDISVKETGASFKSLLTKEHIDEVFDDIKELCR